MLQEYLTISIWEKMNLDFYLMQIWFKMDYRPKHRSENYKINGRECRRKSSWGKIEFLGKKQKVHTIKENKRN